MSKDWSAFNVKYFTVPMTMLVLGMVIGFGIRDSAEHKPHKEYPVKVECYWQTNGYASYPNMECDSIKGDTIYKDGNSIIGKNIINVTFK